MKINSEQVKKIASLARLNVDGKEEAFAGWLTDILVMVEQLNEVNTDGVEPMTSVVPTDLPMREDFVNDGGIRDDILANAPKSEYGCFAVPKVIE